MTALELALQALEQWAAATPGPWGRDPEPAISGLLIGNHWCGVPSPHDATAVATARTREPQLAAEFLRLMEAVAMHLSETDAGDSDLAETFKEMGGVGVASGSGVVL